MTARRRAVWTVALALSAGVTPLFAQQYPVRPIRILTAPVSGALDIGARMIAPAITEGLGQQAVVDNRGGILSIETAAKSRPDGYTLLVHGSVVWLLPFMRDKAPWDPLKDFLPITLLMTAPSVLVVHPSLPVKTVKDLVALAKSKPGQLNYGSGGAGVITHLAGEMFKAMSDTSIVRIPYGGTGPALNAMIAGEVQVMFPAALSAMPHVKSNRLRALAVATAQPSALAPGLPTMIASGFPGFESGATTALLAPAGTPQPIVQALHREVTKYLNRPDTRERLLFLGNEVIANTPAEFTATIKSDMTKWGKVIRDAGIRDE